VLVSTPSTWHIKMLTVMIIAQVCLRLASLKCAVLLYWGFLLWFCVCRLLQKFVNNMKFDVEFNINRFPLNLQHRAVELAAKHKLGDVMFPSDKGIGHTALPNLRSTHIHIHRQLSAHVLGISSLMSIR